MQIGQTNVWVQLGGNCNETCDLQDSLSLSIAFLRSSAELKASDFQLYLSVCLTSLNTKKNTNNSIPPQCLDGSLPV